MADLIGPGLGRKGALLGLFPQALLFLHVTFPWKMLSVAVGAVPAGVVASARALPPCRNSESDAASLTSTGNQGEDSFQIHVH